MTQPPNGGSTPPSNGQPDQPVSPGDSPDPNAAAPLWPGFQDPTATAPPAAPASPGIGLNKPAEPASAPPTAQFGPPDPGQPAPPQYGQQPYGQPGYGQPGYDQPAYGQPPQAPPYGQPAAQYPPPGQPVSGQPYPNQPYPGQPTSGQPYPGQPVSGQPYPGQPVSGQPYPGQPTSGQPYGAPAAPYPGQPTSGQPYGGPGEFTQAGFPTSAPGYPAQPGQPGYGQQPPKKRRGVLIVSIVLAVVVLLCGVGGVAAFLVLRDTETTDGAAEPVAAVEGFLKAVYTDRNAAQAAGLVCSEARDDAKITNKVDEVANYSQTYDNPRFNWETPKVDDQNDERAIVSVKLTMVTGDEKTSEQQLKFTVVQKTGWWVCEVG